MKYNIKTSLLQYYKVNRGDEKLSNSHKHIYTLIKHTGIHKSRYNQTASSGHSYEVDRSNSYLPLGRLGTW